MRRTSRRKSNNPYTTGVLDKTISNVYGESLATTIASGSSNFDAGKIFVALQNNRKNVMLRCEGNTLDVYSNKKDWLLELTKKIDVFSFYEPYDQKVLDYLLDNTNVEIIDKHVEWVYKAYLGNYVDSNFADFCSNNKKNIRIGNKALECISNSYYCNGYYFYTKTEKFLMLAKIAAGGDITRVVKYVNREELNK